MPPSDPTRVTGANIGLTIPPGTRLNGIFEIERQIGAGGMGMVYRAHNMETGDAVAIKIVRAELADNQQVLALFRKEAAVLHKLFHDAIVRYYLFTSDPDIGRPYLATEFVDGTSLADITPEGPLSRDDVLSLAVRLADGLKAAHAVPIFHRDISPDNVILPDRDVKRAKIIDFGIAKAATIGGGTVIGDSIAGKFDYMSPEQLGLFGAQVDGRSDIYSLGIVLAEATLGRGLDMGGTQLEVVEKRRRVPDLSSVDPGLRGLLTAMTQPRPEDRIQTMAAVADEATRLRTGGAAGGKSRKGGFGKIAAGVAGLAVIGGAAAFLLSDRDNGTVTDSDPPPSLVQNSGGEDRAPSLTPTRPDPFERDPEPIDGGLTDELDNTPPVPSFPGDPAETEIIEATAGDDPVPTDAETSGNTDIEIAAIDADETPAPNTALPNDPLPDSLLPDGSGTDGSVAAPPVSDAVSPIADEPGTVSGDPADIEDADASPPSDDNGVPPLSPTDSAAPDDGMLENGATENDPPSPPTGETAADAPSVVIPDLETIVSAIGGGIASITEGEEAQAPSDADAAPPAPQDDPPAETPVADPAPPADPPAQDPEDLGETEIARLPDDVADPPGPENTPLPADDPPPSLTPTDDRTPVPSTGADDLDSPDRVDERPADDLILADPPADDGTEVDIAAIDPDSRVAPAGEPEHGVMRYVRQSNLGPCTHLRLTRVGPDSATIDAYGATVPPFQRFDQDFEKSMGFEAQINLRPITSNQCSAVDLVDRLTPNDGGSLRFQVDDDIIGAGDVLSGAITGINGRDLQVFLVGSDGRLYNLGEMVTRGRDDASIHTVMSGSSGPAESHLLLAIAGTALPDPPRGANLDATHELALMRLALGAPNRAEAVLGYFKYRQ